MSDLEAMLGMAHEQPNRLTEEGLQASYERICDAMLALDDGTHDEQLNAILVETKRVFRYAVRLAKVEATAKDFAKKGNAFDEQGVNAPPDEIARVWGEYSDADYALRRAVGMASDD